MYGVWCVPGGGGKSSCTGVFYLLKYTHDCYVNWSRLLLTTLMFWAIVNTAREVIDVPLPQQDYVPSLSPPPPGPFTTAKTSSMLS